MLRIDWYGNPPSKSNSNRWGKGRWYKDKKLVQFEDELVAAFRKALGYEVQWYVPATALKRRNDRLAQGKDVKGPVARAENPLFPLGVDVAVSVTHYRLNRFAGPDVDNLHKAIWDAATAAGVWYDDKQIAVSRSERVHPTPQSRLEITVTPLGGAALPSPLSRQEWLRQKIAEQAIPEQPINIVVFCQVCHIGIGQGCIEHEVWLLPVKERSAMRLEPICGECADRLGLPLDLRVVSPKEMDSLTTIDAMALIQQRRKELSVVVAR